METTVGSREQQLETILHDIIKDGYLSDTQTARAHALLGIECISKDTRKNHLLDECRTAFKTGSKPARLSAIKRYRSEAGTTLREAFDAVTQGEPV